MRTLFLTLCCVCGFAPSLSAQFALDAKVNVGSALTGGVNVAADLPLSENISVALGAAYAANPFGLNISTDDGEVKFRNVRLIPEFRYYLNPRYRADRFFVGGYGKLGRLSITEWDNQLDASRAVLGFLFGHKWVAESGFVFELNAGFGRGFTLGDGDREREFELAYGTLSRYDLRLGILVGYRFGERSGY